MRMLSCLLLLALPAFPALAAGTEPAAGAEPAQVTAAQASPVAQEAQPRKKRALACPACRTDEMPSFAIRPATGPASAAAAAPPAADGTDAPGKAASQPPVNFSFSGSADGTRSYNRYRGGVYMAAPF